MQTITHTIERLNSISVLRNLLMGATLCYAVEKEKYNHIPIIVIFPSIYAGYQTYSNRTYVHTYFFTCITDLKKSIKY